MDDDTVSCRIRTGDKSDLAATFALDDVKIRAFQSFDQQDCREFFTKCIEAWISDVLQTKAVRPWKVLPTVSLNKGLLFRR